MKKSDKLILLRGVSVKINRVKDLVSDHYGNGGKGTGTFDTDEHEAEFNRLVSEAIAIIMHIQE
jgi:hypothetical protein